MGVCIRTMGKVDTYSSRNQIGQVRPKQTAISVIRISILVPCACLLFQILRISYFSFAIYLLVLLFLSIHSDTLLLRVCTFDISSRDQFHFTFSPGLFLSIALPAFQLLGFLISFCSHVYPGVDFLFILTLDAGFSL